MTSEVCCRRPEHKEIQIWSCLDSEADFKAEHSFGPVSLISESVFRP
jgi:hypothetical protein